MTVKCKEFERHVNEVEKIVGFNPREDQKPDQSDFQDALDTVIEEMKAERKEKATKALRDVLKTIREVVKAREDLERTCETKLWELKRHVKKIREYLGEEVEDEESDA